MRLGIIGIPNSGKTTIFNALTGSNYETAAVSSGQFEINTAIVTVPDERLSKLSAMYSPKKTVFATINYVDIAGLDKGISDGGLKGQFRNELSQVDGFLHVIRDFESDAVPHPYIDVDPQRDLDTIDTEFLLEDLVTVERRLERINDDIRVKGKKVEAGYAEEIELLSRLKTQLEADKPLRELDFTAEQAKTLRGFGLLSMKPVLVVVNMGDDAKDVSSIIKYDFKKSAVVGIQGALEAEMAQLDAEDAEMFMEEYGITELSASRVIRLSYELMTIQSFFTVGEDECRAWSVPVGATAPEAAAAIHTDLQRGFIRAEVMDCNDLLEAGSESAVKKVGKMRLEGKEYIVKDGDIMHIRANT